MEDNYILSGGTLTVLPEAKYLRAQQFAGREDIEKVIVSPGVGFMEEEVFMECPNLREAELPEGMINIGIAAFANCPVLSRVTLPSTLTQIQDGAFLFCESLTAVTLPERLEEIDALAFQGSGLTAVTVVESVRSIGEEAFFQCDSLVHADVLNPHCSIGENAFGSCYGLQEGYMAPGYPEERSNPAELLYSMLWCSCPDRHSEETCRRAERFIRQRESLVMEKVLKYNNVPALTGLVERGLLDPANIDAYLQTALEEHLTQLSALLLRAKGAGRNTEEEFEL